jgi:hypothetical protein
MRERQTLIRDRPIAHPFHQMGDAVYLLVSRHGAFNAQRPTSNDEGKTFGERASRFELGILPSSGVAILPFQCETRRLDAAKAIINP